MDAINTPIRRSRKETHSDDQLIEQRDSIDMSGEEVNHENIVLASAPLTTDYGRNLAFMEEPVTIRIEKSAEKHAPLVVDCWVNGRGAEVFLNGQWLVLGYLPVAREITTKRKYLEVMARSKVDNIQTNVGEPGEENPRNTVDISTSSKAPFSVLEDKNPMGREWLSRLMREQS